MAGSTTSVRDQVPALSSTPAPTSASSSLRPILRHSDSDSRSSPETSFTQDNSRLHSSTIPRPWLSHNESTIGGRRIGSEVVYPDNRESEQEADTKETAARMSEKSSAGKREVVGTGEEVEESFLAPMKNKSKMHHYEIWGKVLQMLYLKFAIKIVLFSSASPRAHYRPSRFPERVNAVYSMENSVVQKF
ncbi:hypothetical protein BYT27DRAFT_7335842 [Phlegmacium glaucopus]|nr:hypothetical protein BYT27DRAFT_7335842 [Phlegmacium glaucopus]